MEKNWYLIMQFNNLDDLIDDWVNSNKTFDTPMLERKSKLRRYISLDWIRGESSGDDKKEPKEYY